MGDIAGPMKEGLRLRAAPSTAAKLLPDRSFLRQPVLGTHRTGCDTGQSSVPWPIGSKLLVSQSPMGGLTLE